MAAASPESTTAARPALTCSICLEVFVDPATCVPCGHSFCWNCLSKWLGQPLSRLRRPCPKCTQGIQSYSISYSLKDIVESLHGDLVALRRRNEAFATPPAPSAYTGGYARSDTAMLMLGMAVFILALCTALTSIESSIELIVPSDQWPVYGHGALRLVIVTCAWCGLMVVRGGPAEWLVAAEDVRARTRARGTSRARGAPCAHTRRLRRAVAETRWSLRACEFFFLDNCTRDVPAHCAPAARRQRTDRRRSEKRREEARLTRD